MPMTIFLLVALLALVCLVAPIVWPQIPLWIATFFLVVTALLHAAMPLGPR